MVEVGAAAEWRRAFDVVEVGAATERRRSWEDGGRTERAKRMQEERRGGEALPLFFLKKIFDISNYCRFSVL